MAEGKKINDTGVLDVSAVVDGTLYPVYDPNRPTSAARSSAKQIANYVKNKVNADAAHASEQEDTDQAKLASVGKVQELIGEGRRVVPISSTPATLDRTVIYLVHDNESGIPFGTETVPAGTTAYVYHDGNDWVAVAENSNTLTPEAIMAAFGSNLDKTSDTSDPNNEKLPTVAKVVEMIGQAGVGTDPADSVQVAGSIFDSLSKKFMSGSLELAELAQFRPLAHLLSSGLAYTKNGKGLNTNGNEIDMGGKLFSMIPVNSNVPMYLYCGAPTSGYCTAVFYKKDGTKIGANSLAVVRDTNGYIVKSDSWLLENNVAFVSFCISNTEYNKNDWFFINSSLYSIAMGAFNIPYIIPGTSFTFDADTMTMHIGSLYYFYGKNRKYFSINQSFTFSDSAPLLRTVIFNTIKGTIRTSPYGCTDSALTFDDGDVTLLSISNGNVVGGALYNYYLNAVKKDVVDSYQLPYETLGQLNAVKRAYQMAAISWTPVSITAANHIPTNNGNGEVFNMNGYKGVPYSSCKEFYGYVPQCVSYHTFLSAVRNKQSILYTEDVGKSSSKSSYGRTYNGSNCHTYYGSVCSSLVSHAIGLGCIFGTNDYEKALPDIKPIASQNADYVMPGDMLLSDGHIMLVTNVIKNADGTTKTVEITHSAGIRVATLTFTALRFNRLIKEYRDLHPGCPSVGLGEPYVILRYSKLYNNDTYIADVEVPILDEQGMTADALPVLPILGDRCNFVKSGSSRDLPIKLLLTKPSADYTKIQIYKGDGEEPSETVELTSGMTSLVIDSTNYPALTTYGDYKARMVGDSDDVVATEFCYWKVVEISVDITPISKPINDSDPTHPTVSFSSKGATPYAFSKNGIGGGTGPWLKETGDSYNQSVMLIDQSNISYDSDTDTYSGTIDDFFWPKKSDGSFYELSELSYIYARVMFINDYGMVINPTDSAYIMFVDQTEN